jgi:hypothetical protein
LKYTYTLFFQGKFHTAAVVREGDEALTSVTSCSTMGAGGADGALAVLAEFDEE